MNFENLLPLLLDLGLKSGGLVLAALVADFALRRNSAANRHIIWLTLLAILLLLPLTAFTSPRWIFAWDRSPHPPAPHALTPTLSVIDPQTDHSRATIKSESIARHTTPIHWATLGGMAWMIGAALVLLHRVTVSWNLTRLIKHSKRTTDERLLSFARKLAPQNTAHSELRESESCRVPLVFGMRRPVILFPVEARDWSQERLSAVLLHEFGHVRRRDCLTRLLMDFVCAIYWANPLVWIASRKMRMAQEQACDDIVLSAGLNATDYASQIVELVRSLGSDRLIACHALAMAQPSSLETRVRAIVDAQCDRRAPGRRAFAGGWIALCVALVLCGATRLRGADEKPAAPQAPQISPATEPKAADAPTKKEAGSTTEVTSDSIVFDKEKGTFTASGNAVIKTGNILIVTDLAVIKPTNPQEPFPKSAARLKAEAIILPKLALHDASIADAVDYLNRNSKLLDPTHEGVSIAVQETPGIHPHEDARVTLNLSSIPVYEALRYIGELADLEIVDGQDAIILRTKDRAGRFTAPAPGSPEAMFMERAGKVMIPHIQFTNATANEAVHFLFAKISESAPDAQGVNIVLKDSKDDASLRITMDLTNVPLTEALRYVAELGGLDLEVDTNAFYLHPRKR